MFRKYKIQSSSSRYSLAESALTEVEQSKCKQKFNSFKTEGSTMLSKHMLRKALKELGQDITEEQLLEMIYSADPNGHGYISEKAFERIISVFKQSKEENVIIPIGQTFDEILRSYLLEHPNKMVSTLSWQYIQEYLQQNFGLKVNLKNFRTTYAKNQLSKEEFQHIFS